MNTIDVGVAVYAVIAAMVTLYAIILIVAAVIKKLRRRLHLEPKTKNPIEYT
jgi:hypothetical protein